MRIKNIKNDIVDGTFHNDTWYFDKYEFLGVKLVYNEFFYIRDNKFEGISIYFQFSRQCLENSYEYS